MQLTPTQNSAMKEVWKWYRTCVDEQHSNTKFSKPFFYLAGYAGTGKTTLVGEFVDCMSGRICYAAYTGKAAMQMRKQDVDAQTIHSLCYRPRQVKNKKGKWVVEFELNPESELVFAKLLVIDECSMVGKDMGNDLLSFGVPILVLGDPGQLPPVKGTAYFTGRKPDVMLEEVHRQALDSPILRVATEVREGKTLKRTEEDRLTIYPMGMDDDRKKELLLTCEQAITGTNKTRAHGNSTVRKLRGIEGPYPLAEERLVCLRNNRQVGLFNGLIVNTLSASQEKDATVKFDIETELGHELNGVYVLKACFHNYTKVKELEYRQRARYDEFDYGYVLTVHKSQGSQWDDVLLIDDGFLRWDRDQRKRWLYTGITRAAETLTIVRP